jgi:hypothetical protein
LSHLNEDDRNQILMSILMKKYENMSLEEMDSIIKNNKKNNNLSETELTAITTIRSRVYQKTMRQKRLENMSEEEIHELRRMRAAIERERYQLNFASPRVKSERTPEEIEKRKELQRERARKYYQNKINNSSPEELEAMRQKRREYAHQRWVKMSDEKKKELLEKSKEYQRKRRNSIKEINSSDEINNETTHKTRKRRHINLDNLSEKNRTLIEKRREYARNYYKNKKNRNVHVIGADSGNIVVNSTVTEVSPNSVTISFN